MTAADLTVLTRPLSDAFASGSNIEFRYFEGLGHGLGSTDSFMRGAHSAGYAAIFDFIKRHSGAN